METKRGGERTREREKVVVRKRIYSKKGKERVNEIKRE